MYTTVVTWHSVSEKMPSPLTYVLALVQNGYAGKPFIIRAMWNDGKSLEAHEDNPEAVWDEDADIFYALPGWYEENAYEDIHWRVTDNVIGWAEMVSDIDDLHWALTHD